MQSLDLLFDELWRDYASMNRQAGAIHRALEGRGEKVVNDHIAFRTFDIPKVGIDVMAKPFLESGYLPAGGPYYFAEKKLIARHFEPVDSKQPKVFISALQIGEFSGFLQKTIRNLADQMPAALPGCSGFLTAGTPWEKIPYRVYQDMLKESEYAAWMSAFGFRVNHFTVFFNSLKNFRTLAQLNEFIKSIGFELNSVGGEIKGSPRVYLEQSSTLAYPVEVEFSDQKKIIPGCYYEFARRYPTPDGRLFQGFLPDSADKIFESTNVLKK